MAQFTRTNGTLVTGELTLHINNKVPLRLSADPAEKKPFKIVSSAPLLAEAIEIDAIGKGPSLRFKLFARGAGSTTVSAVTSTEQGAAKSAATLSLIIKARLELPDPAQEPGAVARLLLAENRSPWAAGYEAAQAQQSMQWMRLVLINRLANNPAQFLATNAKSVVDIIKAPKQFEGFSGYPKLSATIAKNLSDILAIANDDTHSKQAAFINHVNFAISVAGDAPVSDPCPGKLYGWRTKGASSPGPRFQLFKSIGGNDFYTLK